MKPKATRLSRVHFKYEKHKGVAKQGLQAVLQDDTPEVELDCTRDRSKLQQLVELHLSQQKYVCGLRLLHCLLKSQRVNKQHREKMHELFV